MSKPKLTAPTLHEIVVSAAADIRFLLDLVGLIERHSRAQAIETGRVAATQPEVSIDLAAAANESTTIQAAGSSNAEATA